jgi:UDP-N-acetylmuramyl pentapeptide synthase
LFELIDVKDLKTLSTIIDGELIGENKPFTSLITDSRKVKKNSVFWPYKEKILMAITFVNQQFIQDL